MKKEIQPLLTYEGPDQFKLRDNLRTRKLDTKAALKFKHFGDPRARRFFNRALVKFFDAPLDGLPPFLDPHQVEGVRWMLSRSRSYLAHAPGAGKTFQAFTAARYAMDVSMKGPLKALFIVPPSLTATWRAELIKYLSLLKGPQGFAMGLKARDIDDWLTIVPESARRAECNFELPVIICPDSMLHKDWVATGLAEHHYHFLAVDEASRFKERTAARTKVLFGGRVKSKEGDRVHSGLIYRARHVALMDGSPMPNRPMELWAPLFAMAPEVIGFKSQEEFGLRYCGAKMNDFGQWEFKHSSNEDELQEKITRSFMHVVTEDRLNHPERLRKIIVMTNDPRTPSMREWEQSVSADMVVDRAEEGRETPGKLATWRRELGLTKIDWTVRYVQERREKNEAVLVFAWHREVCERLHKALSRGGKNARGHGVGLIMGGISAEARETAINNFTKGRLDVLVLNIAAAGRGLNLQRADRVVFCEPSWTDELNRQCEKRASRKGRDVDKPVRSDYIVVPNSLDERIMRTLFRKEKTVKRIIR